ncbi:zinc ABC transporter ATP-binding protein ZnuC [Vibrio sp.]|nr:zinc ABC transporter ATP-binding protein ZnuC [Vibrio sp.]
MKPLVELQNICVTFGSKRVLDNVTITLNKGEITTLIGPNGAGKSTLVKVLLGFPIAYTGQVHRLNGLTVGYVPQKLKLNETLPIHVLRFLKLAGRFSQQELTDALRLVGAEHLLNSSMHHLSGGETQRVLLARALLRRPQLLVLDEPAQGVDLQGQIEFYDLINKICQRFQCSIFMVSHDLHLVMAKTDNVICLHHHICCSGVPADIAQHPSYIALFGNTLASNFAVYQHHHHHHHDLSGDTIDGDAHQCSNPKHGHISHD